jgi:uncharacterized protein YjbI with pentapeptide repeats
VDFFDKIVILAIGEAGCAMGQCIVFSSCGLDDSADPDGRSCILHSRKRDKDASMFRAAFDKYREQKSGDLRFIAFPEGIEFTGQVFKEKVDFFAAKFFGNAGFRKAVFERKADFSAAEFDGDATFSEAQFTQGVTFNHATFNGEGNFDRAIFSEDRDKNARTIPPLKRYLVTFDNTRFLKKCNFFEARFAGSVWFNNTDFSEEALFIDCTFEAPSGFVGSHFDDRASFLFADFQDSTSFLSAVFSTEAYFEGTRFHNRVNFQGADLRGNVLFSGKGKKEEEAKGQSEMGGSPGRLIFRDWGWRYADRQFTDVVLDFRNVRTSQAKSIVFRYVDLTRCLFEDTDVRRIEFIDAAWPWVKGRWRVYDEGASRDERGAIRTDVNGDVAVFQEPETRVEQKNFPWGSIERLYRELKRQHDDGRDYQKAGDFHYGEKEMQRRNPRTPWNQKAVLLAYKCASGYGETYFLPLLWGAVVLLGSAALYLSSGLEARTGTGYSPAHLQWSKWSDWARSTLFSFRVMTLLKPDEYVPAGYGLIVNTIETLLGPVFLGLFALALRQRLKR